MPQQASRRQDPARAAGQALVVVLEVPTNYRSDQSPSWCAPRCSPTMRRRRICTGAPPAQVPVPRRTASSRRLQLACRRTPPTLRPWGSLPASWAARAGRIPPTRRSPAARAAVCRIGQRGLPQSHPMPSRAGRAALGVPARRLMHPGWKWPDRQARSRWPCAQCTLQAASLHPRTSSFSMGRLRVQRGLRGCLLEQLSRLQNSAGSSAPAGAHHRGGSSGRVLLMKLLQQVCSLRRQGVAKTQLNHSTLGRSLTGGRTARTPAGRGWRWFARPALLCQCAQQHRLWVPTSQLQVSCCRRARRVGLFGRRGPRRGAPGRRPSSGLRWPAAGSPQCMQPPA
mmetsp:Transcript_91550/g.259320  ORF Transcript_91550/g.259320 Transcript_91550/m.259320 type:complete len:340 (-) Transcript_91550:85-1104(-)